MRVSAIMPGDLVEVDKKGRRFLARVTEVDQRSTIPLWFEPVCPNISYRHAHAREVIGHWVRAGRRRPPGGRGGELVGQGQLVE